MDYLEDITTDELHRVLDAVEGKLPAMRVLAGLSYKDDVPQQTIATRFGVHRNTVRNWLRRLERLENEPYETVVYDSPRPGRPRSLTEREYETFAAAISADPALVGIDAPHWTASTAQEYLRSAFDVEYTHRHVRRLLSEIE